MHSQKVKSIILGFIVVVSMFVIPHFAHADITTGLVGWWKFDEGSGTTAIDSGSRGHNGGLTGTPSYVLGKIGSHALSFNPAHPDYVNIGNYDGETGDFTLSAWVKPASFSGYNGVIEKTQATGYTGCPAPFDWYINQTDGVPYWLLGRDGGCSLAVDYNYIHSNNATSIGVWSHWVFTYVASTKVATIYYNGAYDNSATMTFNGTSNGSGDLRIGTRMDFVTNMNGSIDDARIYNRALSSADVTELYNYTGAQSAPTNLIKFSKGLIKFIKGHIQFR